MPYVTDPQTGYQIWQDDPKPAGQQIGQMNSSGQALTQQKDNNGNAVPLDPNSPEFMDWWRQNRGSQGVEGQLAVGQMDLQKTIDAGRQAVTPPTAAGTGQFNPGTRQSPTLDQILASTPGGASPTAGFTGPMGAPRATTGAQPIGVPGGFDMGGGKIANPTKVGQAASQASDALGQAPQLDQGIADRQLGAYQEALGMSREVLDRLLNGPSVAEKVGARALENQLAVARSARGGPGAVQDALNAAQQQAPQLQAQASQQAVSEENAKLATAGNVASNFAQAALGARGQDVQIASENTRAATALIGEITKLTGTQLQLDQQNEQFLGQMARDWAQLDFDFTKMSVDAQNAWFDRQVQIYGIDQQTAAQMKAIAAGENIGPADWFNGIVGIIGAGATVGAAAAGKPKV